MNKETEARLGELQHVENDKLAAFEAACEKLTDIARRDADDDEPYPSKTERRAVRDEVVATEAELNAVREEIRKLMWADEGIEEGEPITIGIDNVAAGA